MNNFWWNNYIGIPYMSMGCSKEGCDCWGLVRLVYKQEFGIDIPGVTVDMTDADKATIVPMGLDALWDKTDNPQSGDVINFHILGHDRHVGIVTTPGYMLHVYDNGHTSCIEPYTSRKWKNRIAGIYTYAHSEKLVVPTDCDNVSVIGKPHPLKSRVTSIFPAGTSLSHIINKMCDDMNVPEYMRKRGVACVNLVYIPQDRWDTTYLSGGDTVIFRLQGVAGGGGKMNSILGIGLIVAAAALTWWAGGSGAAIVGGFLGVAPGIAGGLMAVVSLGLTVAGMALLNNSKAAKPRDLKSNFVNSTFLSGGQNQLRPYETIPQVLGIGRMMFDYLGKPYTEQADQYTNYLRAAFTAGYGQVTISDIRNGDTPIRHYNNVQCNIYSGTGNDQRPKLYTRTADEDSVNITLSRNVHNYRTTAEDVDQIQIVLYWPQGLWYRTSIGKKRSISSSGVIRYRSINGSWNDLHKAIRPKTLTFPQCDPYVSKTISYNQDASEEWRNRYGTNKHTYATYETFVLYRWYTITIQQNTGNIRSYAGGVTDRMDDEASSELVNEIRKGRFYGWDAPSISEPRLAGIPTGETLLAYICVKGDEIISIEDHRADSKIDGCELTKNGLSLSIAEGAMQTAGSNTWSFSKYEEMRAFTRVITIDVPRGQYEVDVRLTSSDDKDKANWKGSSGLQVQWLVLRSFTFTKPFVPRKPLAWFELRIKATDQLSGALEEINGAVASVVLDYDYKTRKWVKRASSNPASLFRHVLQGPAIADRYRVDDAHIDIKKLEDWHNYCRIQGFTYFKVVGADSEMSVYDLLTEIAAAGYAKPLLKPEEGGIWSVWVDEPQTTVMQHFTEHNTWGTQWTKNNVDIPHAIRATFVNKDKGYEQDTVTVYVDGYNSTTATKYENWGIEYFEGVTDIKNVQRICRRALAYAKLRPETLSFMCAMEHVTSQFGDLVRVTNSFVQWGLGSGWVVAVYKNGTKCTGVKVSDSVTLNAGTEYSIRFRRAGAKGQSVKYDIQSPTSSKQTSDIYFVTPIEKGWPNVGDLYQFGYKGKESHECLIQSIVPESGDIARITVCDYSPELYEIDDGPIPSYDAGISTPQELPSSVISSVPKFVEARSGEDVLLVGPDGSLVPRIAVTWERPANCEPIVSHIQFRYRISDASISEGVPEDDIDTGAMLEPGSWFVLDYTPIENTTAYITPVVELLKYDIEARFLSRFGIAGQWARMVYNHKVIGKTSLPPTVKNFTATISSPLGILLEWERLDIVDIARYRITGDATVETTGSSVMVQVKNKTGTLTFNLQAIDTGGRMSETPAVATVKVLPPSLPSGFKSDTRNDGLYLIWDDCDKTWPVRHYIITDEYVGKTSKELRTQTVISPRAVGSYSIKVQAVDIFGNSSKQATHGLVIQQPSTPKPKLEISNGVARVSWKAVSTSFPIKTYQVYDVNGQLLQETASTFYDINGPAGVLEYRIRAVDTAGNMSAFGEFAFTLEPPEAPQVTVALNRNKDGLDITWNVPNSVLPVITYDVVRQWDETLDGGIIETKEQDYGSTDATALAVPAIPANTHTFMVRAVDASGNRSGWGTFDLAVRNPGPAFLTDVNVIDNNVMIYWQEPKEQFFAIQYYNFGTVEDGYFSLIGRIDARFASRFEKQAGSYTYQVCPVDVAGNIGQCSNITAQVAQPPDFVFFDDKDSTFNGTKVNSELDGAGNMIMGVYPNETWNENTSRVAALLNTSADTLTWQQKINGGYPVWQSPFRSPATYTETVDVGTLVPATSITVTTTSRVLEGSPILSCKIEVKGESEDDPWREMADGAFFTFATSFRYVRYTFTVTGGMLLLSNINYRLDVKKLSDFGSVYSKSTDNGTGFVDVDTTPMLYGTWVPFSVSFTDVQSGPMAFCNEQNKTAYVVFEDVLKPKGFRVFVLDKNGNRTSGQVSWSAHGV